MNEPSVTHSSVSSFLKIPNGKELTTEFADGDLFAIDSLFDDTDPFLFEELNTEQDQGSCDRCTRWTSQVLSVIPREGG